MAAPTAIYSPGPGTYETRGIPGATRPKYTLKGKAKHISSTRDNPGPGTYTVPKSQIDKPTAAQYSLGPRTEQLTRDEVPGPGTYERDHRIGEGPSSSLHTRVQGGSSSDKVPGPGTYEEWGNVGTNSRKHTIQGRPKGKDFSDSPGPGNYEAYSVFKKNPNTKAWSMRGKCPPPDYNAGVPGPSAYYPEPRLMKDAPQHSFGQPLFDGGPPELSPGPAAYYPADKMGSAVKKSFGHKRKGGGKNENPGPGTYTPRSFGHRRNAPQYSLGPRTSRSYDDRTPGPGTYETVGTPGHGKRAAAMHTRFSGSQTARTLGHEYTPRDMNKGPSCSLGGRVYSVNYDATPGPGSYNVSKGFGKKGYTWKGRTEDNSKNFVPGPGAYTPSKPSTAPKYSLGFKHDRACTIYASSSNPMQSIKS